MCLAFFADVFVTHLTFLQISLIMREKSYFQLLGSPGSCRFRGFFSFQASKIHLKRKMDGMCHGVICWKSTGPQTPVICIHPGFQPFCLPVLQVNGRSCEVASWETNFYRQAFILHVRTSLSKRKLSLLPAQLRIRPRPGSLCRSAHLRPSASGPDLSWSGARSFSGSVPDPPVCTGSLFPLSSPPKSRFSWSYRFPGAPGTSGPLMPTEPASPWPSALPLRSASPAHRSAALVFFSSSSPPCACPSGPPLSGRTYSDIAKLLQRLTAHHVGDPFPLFCRKGQKLYFSTFCFDDIGVCNGQIASPPG